MKVSDSLSIQVLQCENFVVYTYWSDGPGAGTEFMDELNPILEARPSYKKAKDYQTEVPDAKGVEVVVLELFEHSKADRRVAG